MHYEISLKDPHYPDLLKATEVAPEKLYIKTEKSDAELTSIFTSCLAVVGSRRMTTYGKRVVDSIVKPLASAGVTIVSGFMYGIDASSHQAALSVGGNTVAVMAGGCDVICPSYQQKLYREINDYGVILSEHSDGVTPKKWSFAKRNRIVAGISQAILVVEAGLNSGSLITASYAQKFGRQVFAVPGSIFSENSFGTYYLIEQGAKMITSADELLDFFQFSPSFSGGVFPEGNPTSFENLDDSGKNIISLLKKESLSVDELSSKLSPPVDISTLASKLTNLCLLDLVSENGGKYHAN